MLSNRAAAYIKRKWHGDFYAALIDCVTALKLDPDHMKAHFRLAVCLYELEKYSESKMYLDQFTMKFPVYKTSTAFKVLRDDISLAQNNMENMSGGNHIICILDLFRLLRIQQYTFSIIYYYLLSIKNNKYKKIIIFVRL